MECIIFCTVAVLLQEAAFYLNLTKLFIVVANKRDVNSEIFCLLLRTSSLTQRPAYHPVIITKYPTVRMQALYAQSKVTYITNTCR